MGKTKTSVTAVFCAAAMILNTGCATVTGGSKQNIGLRSTPESATVTSTKSGMTAQMTYTTPVTVAFERKGHYILSFGVEGYDSKQIELLRSMRGWMLFWDIFWFPLGVVVDAITGAWYRLDPDQVNVKLNKLSAEASGPDQIEVSVSGLERGDALTITSDGVVTVGVRGLD